MIKHCSLAKSEFLKIFITIATKTIISNLNTAKPTRLATVRKANKVLPTGTIGNTILGVTGVTKSTEADGEQKSSSIG